MCDRLINNDLINNFNRFRMSPLNRMDDIENIEKEKDQPSIFPPEGLSADVSAATEEEGGREK